MIRQLRLPALALAVLLASGCAVIQPVVPAAAAPDAASAYIAGAFTRVSSGGFAFIARNADTGEEYALPLGADTPFPTDVENQVVAIKVPPGRYAITQWITYATLTKERITKSNITNAVLSEPFTVAPGSVTYLGNYSVTTTRAGTSMHFRISPKVVTSADARTGFLKAYPGFQSQSFACKLCVDTVLARVPRPAAAASSPAPAPSAVK
ncbi:hypothetical protein [Piscinibacter sp. HJYY11]|uniref:hypothetical protein n=1 Tax=Piscinibacter sp. HJYY11 TaxID=2801333 RepID=UPI00191E3F28|nr:hypothetical protein [Piscinibacter sp. HJYY11]MBL0728807.1 hypothetical protein [Piscinibacter sp. HJYY11]